MNRLQALHDAGVSIWLDTLSRELLETGEFARLIDDYAVTGATSNPIIVADLIKTGRFDDMIQRGIESGMDDETLAWHLTDQLVRRAQAVFAPVWEERSGSQVVMR